MGGKQSQIYDPNRASQPSNKPKEPNQANNYDIKKAMSNSQGVLNKDKFNQALSVIESMGFKRLRDTPLADRLFFVLDTNRSGTILDSEFTKMISEIIDDKESAVKYTFRAYDKDLDNFISRKEFMQFIEQSWKAAFRILSEGLDEKNAGVKISNIESWTSSKISVLNEESSRLFNKIGGGQEKVDYQSFRNFIIQGQANDVVAKLDDKTVSVPLTLTRITQS